MRLLSRFSPRKTRKARKKAKDKKIYFIVEPHKQTNNRLNSTLVFPLTQALMISLFFFRVFRVFRGQKAFDLFHCRVA